MCRVIGLIIFSSDWLISISGQVSGGVRGGDLPGGELTLVSTKILSTKLKDTTGYGREIST